MERFERQGGDFADVSLVRNLDAIGDEGNIDLALVHLANRLFGSAGRFQGEFHSAGASPVREELGDTIAPRIAWPGAHRQCRGRLNKVGGPEGPGAPEKQPRRRDQQQGRPMSTQIRLRKGIIHRDFSRERP